MPFDNILVLAAAAATEAEGGNVASEISKSFHIYPVTFICQLVNFLIVCVVLRKFAFGPVRAMLDARKKRIADGEAKLVEIEKQIAESEQRTQEAAQEANERAQRLIDEAKASAILLGEKKAQEASAEAKGIIAKAEEAARAERDKLRSELRKEFGRLVVNTTTQVTGKVLDEEDQKRINEEAIAGVEN